MVPGQRTQPPRSKACYARPAAGLCDCAMMPLRGQGAGSPVALTGRTFEVRLRRQPRVTLRVSIVRYAGHARMVTDPDEYRLPGIVAGQGPLKDSGSR